MDTHMAEEQPKQIDTHLDVDKTDEKEVKIQNDIDTHLDVNETDEEQEVESVQSYIDTHLDVDKTDEQEVKIQLPLKLTNINLFYLT